MTVIRTQTILIRALPITYCIHCNNVKVRAILLKFIGGWRDLTKTKYRLSKGDQQLDQSFNNPVHLPPHHVPELLSDIGYYVYKARVLNKETLCQHVRSQWVPEEYPSSMARLYEWTPDECIPEFYSDSNIFFSLHSDMNDILLPSWCENGAEFINWHRSMLESDWVSQRLHHWIDLAFGYKLNGDAAVAAKNVHLSVVDNHNDIRIQGSVQLFTRSHPKRNQKSKMLSVANTFTMEDVVDMGMNPLYELNQRPIQSLRVETETFNLVELAKALYKNQKDVQRSEMVESCLTCVGVILTELCLSQHFRLLPKNATLKQRLCHAKKLIASQANSIPRFLRRAIRLLLQIDGNPPLATDSLDYYQLSPGFLLQPLIDVFNFPLFMHPINELLDHFVSLKRNFIINLLAIRGQDDCSVLMENAENQVRIFAKHLPLLLPNMPIECICIVADFIRIMLDDPWTCVLAAWSLFNNISLYLGPTLTKDYLGERIVSLYNVEQPVSTKNLKLYHRSFLLQLCVRLGTKVFMREIIPHLVEAAAGERDSMFLNEIQLNSYLYDDSFNQLKLESPHSNTHQLYHHLSLVEASIDSDDTPNTESLSDETDFQSEQFHLELASLNLSPSHVKDDLSSREETSSCSSHEVFIPETATSYENDRNEYDKNSLVSNVAKESLIWLSDRLGPVLTSRHLTRNLLRMVALCYASDRLDVVADDNCVQGDELSANVIECLVQIAAIYGFSFILLQYFPFCAELVQQANRRLTVTAESGVLSCVVILDSFFPYLNDKQLMDSLQEPIVDSILFPAVRLASSLKIEFSNIQLRCLLAWKCAKTLHLLGSRVGGDNLKRYMAAPLQRLLCMYDLLYWYDESNDIVKPKTFDDNNTNVIANKNVLTQLQQTFSPQFASKLYDLFSGLCGRRYFQLSLPNADLILSMAQNCSLSKLKNSSSSPTLCRSPSTALMSGNRLSGVVELAFVNESSSLTGERTSKKLEISKRSLRGNWLAQWEYELGRNEKEQNVYFNQIQLMTFVGHSGAIRHLHVLDNENSFISASQDKTVKLWSLRSFGDGSAKCDNQWTYKFHKKPIADLTMVDAMRLIASTDGVLHIWDPMMGTTLRTFDWLPAVGSGSNNAETSGVQFIRSFDAPAKLLLVASSEPALRFVDVRQAKWAHDFKLTPSPHGTIKSIAAVRDESWVAVGFSNGAISVIDLRNGRLAGSARPNDSEVTMLEPCDSEHFVTTNSLSQSLMLWNAKSCSLSCKIPGNFEGTSCLRSFSDQLICSLVPNKVRIYSSRSSKAGFTESKLRSDVFSGSISAFEILPLNRHLIFGSTNGTIQLLC